MENLGVANSKEVLLPLLPGETPAARAERMRRALPIGRVGSLANAFGANL